MFFFFEMGHTNRIYLENYFFFRLPDRYNHRHNQKIRFSYLGIRNRIKTNYRVFIFNRVSSYRN